MRFEKRDAAADPYYLLATDIAAGLDGIEQSLEPSEAPVTGNAYKTPGFDALPTDIRTATDFARQSKSLTDMLGTSGCRSCSARPSAKLRCRESGDDSRDRTLPGQLLSGMLRRDKTSAGSE